MGSDVGVSYEGGFAIPRRDEIELDLWEANGPNTPGAEPHIAGMASCRVLVERIRARDDENRGRQVIHPNGALMTQPWGVEDFTILDLDGNAIAFHEPLGSR